MSHESMWRISWTENVINEETLKIVETKNTLRTRNRQLKSQIYIIKKSGIGESGNHRICQNQKGHEKEAVHRHDELM